MEKGTVYFFTGLAGAGKTTLGKLFYSHLKEKSPHAILLDGDTNRAMMEKKQRQERQLQGLLDQCRDQGISARDYTYEGRLKGAWKLFAWCKEQADQGRDVVVCSISMYHAIQKWNRENIENYREIFVKVSMDTLYKRDQKKLYSSGEKNVVGVDISAEFPEHPDVIVENDGQQTPEEIVAGLERRFGLCG